MEGETSMSTERSTEYYSWSGMKARCYNPKSKDFKNYGMRGIAVCDRWLNSFDAFIEDMGQKPSKDYSIDRIDTNGNYEPENCRWADSTTQNRNHRIQQNNTSGVNGVSYDRVHSLWFAHIKVDGIKKALGRFPSITEAARARQEAELILWGHQS